ncbi:MAG: hypothetical protein ACR2QF_12505, partial [Geminicoccaceae bacterium]
FRASLVATIALALAATPSMADDDDETPFDEAELFFELNNTDGDLGIHGFIDGDAWKKLEIESPEDAQLLMIRATRSVADQGLTELFFESAEPTFDELAPEDFFARFPEGEYEISARTIDGRELESDVILTHLLPAPPNAFVNGEPAAEDCDAELPSVTAPVTISWDAVTESHPELGRTFEPITVVNYEVVVEIDETPFRSSTILPPTTTSFQVPSEILALGDEIKFEILVREESFNQTATESCFLK